MIFIWMGERMKTKIIKVKQCLNKKCCFNLGYSCITYAEIDNHNNCLSCSNKVNFKVYRR